ncbi:MAG: glycosyltransferase, partial [Bacteroidia bacterium]|nr:glycosyltransferase [Bacteroidia bacterium]
MKNILIIALVWPEPNSSAAGAHLLSLIKSLQPIAGKISFGCTSQPSDRSIDLNDINVEAFTIKVNDPEFDNVLAKLNPDLVIFDRYVAEEQFGWRVALNCPKAMRILNTEDLHGLRAARELALKKNEAFDLGHYFNDVAKREVASILRSDMSLIISEFELNWLKTVCHVPETMLVYFPLLINTEAIETSGNLPSFDDRKGYMFIGNFRHQPNVDAIEFLIRDIWPGIREHDNEAELYIFGAYMPKQKSSLQDEDAGIYMKGFAENLESTFQSAKICLAPLRYGAG